MPDTLLTETATVPPHAIEKLQAALRLKSRKNKNLRKSLRELQKAHERSLYMLECGYEKVDRLVEENLRIRTEKSDEIGTAWRWVVGAAVAGLFVGALGMGLVTLAIHFIR